MKDIVAVTLPKMAVFDEIGEGRGGNRRAKRLNGVERVNSLIAYEQQTQVTPFPVLPLYPQCHRSLPPSLSLRPSMRPPLSPA